MLSSTDRFWTSVTATRTSPRLGFILIAGKWQQFKPTISLQPYHCNHIQNCNTGNCVENKMMLPTSACKF
ncbi:hypothetical protein P8452_51311 [Trifolium repens]|nr:hypothetical protein P8452_51311 [Trifolium repens]